MNNMTLTLVNEMARRTGTELSEQHFKVLEYAFDYYEKNKVGPLYPNIKRHTGIEKDQVQKLISVWVEFSLRLDRHSHSFSLKILQAHGTGGGRGFQGSLPGPQCHDLCSRRGERISPQSLSRQLQIRESKQQYKCGVPGLQRYT